MIIDHTEHAVASFWDAPESMSELSIMNVSEHRFREVHRLEHPDVPDLTCLQDVVSVVREIEGGFHVGTRYVERRCWSIRPRSHHG